MNINGQEIAQEVIENASEIYDGLQVKDGEAYRPSNGAEGQIFMNRWCNKCKRNSEVLQVYCDILTMAYRKEQPPEWIYHDNKPICTAFSPREPHQD
ncbi:MAG TPA: hypothetical protein V6D25_30970 [Leptolyngbyaceae cyanobacterium]